MNARSRSTAVTRTAFVAALLPLASCAVPGCHDMLSAQLLFGAPENPAAFTAFLDRNVTPRFPAGLTVLDAAGRWQAPDGRLTQERSKLVLIVAPPGPATIARLQTIRDEYKTQFHQQSVGLLMARTCADF